MKCARKIALPASSWFTPVAAIVLYAFAQAAVAGDILSQGGNSNPAISAAALPVLNASCSTPGEVRSNASKQVFTCTSNKWQESNPAGSFSGIFTQENGYCEAYSGDVALTYNRYGHLEECACRAGDTKVAISHWKTNVSDGGSDSHERYACVKF